MKTLLGSSESVRSSENSSESITSSEDICSEIFRYLPFDTVFKCRCVSKTWLSFLSNPTFINQWCKVNIPYLAWILVIFDDRIDEYHFRIVYPDSHSGFVSDHHSGFHFQFLSENLSSNARNLYLLGSSHGLVLCTNHLFNQSSYCVCNPLTRQSELLPAAPIKEEFIWHVTGFICDECSTGSTSYKVVRIPKFEDEVKEFKLEIYSSDLCVWSTCDVQCTPNVTWEFSPYDNLVTYDGILYWFRRINHTILAVTFDGGVDDIKDCRLIDLPDGGMHGVPGGNNYLHHCLGESEGSICYARIKFKERSLSVWVLKEEWYPLHMDITICDMLAEVESLLIGKENYIQVIGFKPTDRNVVILGYGTYIWAYNTRTMGYEKLCDPSFLGHGKSFIHPFNAFTFSLNPMTTILPPRRDPDFQE